MFIRYNTVMKAIKTDANNYVLRIDPGEELIEQLRLFCEKEKIGGGWFWAIGAAGEVTLSFYNLETREYEDTVLLERLEIASLTGNLAMKKSELIIHAHGSLSSPDLKTYSGHVKKLLISGTCEVLLRAFDVPLTRASDPETGLNILQ